VLRNTSITLLLLLGFALIVPMCVLLNFQLDRARIAKELCVQRAVPEETRTCHGECHLRDQLKPLQQEERQAIPETHVLTLLPVFAITSNIRPFIPELSKIPFGEIQSELTQGHQGLTEHVPRG
jgi:predicted nucleic acid-binding Zn ribbon protein